MHVLVMVYVLEWMTVTTQWWLSPVSVAQSFGRQIQQSEKKHEPSISDSSDASTYNRQSTKRLEKAPPKMLAVYYYYYSLINLR